MKTQPATTHRAFTLIELLVVIAIIAILAAMLLPVLNSAKNRAQLTIDLDNHKQMMASTIMYAGDNANTMPSSGWANPAASQACWAYAPPNPGSSPFTTTGEPLSQYYSTVLPQEITWFNVGQLGPYLKEQAALMCPADKVNDLFLQRNIQFTSYVWNGAVNGYSSAQSPCKITQLKPTNILDWENDETLPTHWNDACNYPDEGISYRHGKGASVGIIDGSTRRVRYEDWYQPWLAGAPGARGANCTLLPNDLWWNPFSLNGR